MLRYHGRVGIPDEATRYAESIKLENYQTNTPAEFQVRRLDGCGPILDQLAIMTGRTRERMDCVFFSCPKGAEPHTDKLNLKRFEETTFIIPVILPPGGGWLETEEDSVSLDLGEVFEFDHTQTHSLRLKDTESGCVLIMVAILKETTKS